LILGSLVGGWGWIVDIFLVGGVGGAGVGAAL